MNSESKINKVLIIQTAFIGDVILTTPIIEVFAMHFPDTKVDILIRKGNEGLLKDHPSLNKIWIWNKRNKKIKNQYKLILEFRKQKYDIVINLQRYLSSGIFTLFSGAKTKIGFNKNPLSFTFTHQISHIIKKGIHEIDRNLSLLNPVCKNCIAEMRLYPSAKDYEKVKQYTPKKYLVLAPTSVWFTKQFPADKWIEFINNTSNEYNIYCIGGPDDKSEIDKIISQSKNRNCINLCGELSLLESTALMQGAYMNFVNDSAPLHMASAVNAAVTAIFCSTITDFGFGPRSSKSFVVENKANLQCRPCGLHGKKECPEGHFNCAKNINTEQLLITLSDDGGRN
jgi:heptosyltransferase-2